MRISSCTKGERRRRAFSLVEVVVSIAVASISLGGVVYGYIIAAQRAEWSAYSLAAQALAIQRVEQARAAKWDPQAVPPVDQLQGTNFPVVGEVLDVPLSGTNVVFATNYTEVTLLSANPPLKMVRVDCVWPFLDRGFYTNTVVTYRGPDQ